MISHGGGADVIFVVGVGDGVDGGGAGGVGAGGGGSGGC